MNMLISQLIRSCNGHCYETAGMVSAFFNDPHQARDCAQKIGSLGDSEVEICGSQLAVWCYQSGP